MSGSWQGGGMGGGAVIPAAAGYGVYENLKDPLFVQDFITRYYARTVGGLICSQDIVPKEITDVGSTVIFRRPPRAVIHEYSKNEDLKADGLNTVPIEMTIDRGLYFNLKLDRVDERQIRNVSGYIDMYKYDALEQIAMRTDRQIFQTMEMQGHPANKGASAGATSGAYNMGSLGAPVTLDKFSILDYTNNASAVLSEANIDFADRFIVFPTCALPTLAGNQVLSQAYASGLPRSMQLVGMEAYQGPIGGFRDIYFSNLLPRRWDPIAGVWTYCIPFGRRDATGFITQLAENEVLRQDTRAFQTFWRGLFVYGMKVLRPEAIGIMYSTLAVPNGATFAPPAGG